MQIFLTRISDESLWLLLKSASNSFIIKKLLKNLKNKILT